MESDEEIIVDGITFNMKKEKERFRHDLEVPTSALEVLHKVNKAYYNRKSIQKKRAARKKALQVLSKVKAALGSSSKNRNLDKL